MSVLVLVPFTVLFCIAILLCQILDYNIAEGMSLSTVLIVGILYISAALTNSFSFGMIVILALTILGIGSSIIPSFFSKRKHEKISKVSVIDLLINPYMKVLLVLLLFFSVIYYNDFIQHIDELHQWAAAPKYMLTTGKLPLSEDYIGREISFGTSIFVYFFEFFTGYNEGVMYVAVNILFWIGILLPFGSYEKKDSKKMFIYILILYISIYSLYIYGAKNLYVDLPLAAWSGGLLCWILVRNKRKRNIILIVSIIILLYEIKNTIGVVMPLIILLYFFYQKFIIEGAESNEKICKHILKISTIILLFAGILVKLVGHIISSQIFMNYLPSNIQEYVLLNGFSEDKISKTTASFLRSFFGNPLGANGSKLGMTPFIVLVLSLILIYIAYYRSEQIYKKYGYALFFIAATMIYMLYVWTGYLLTFSYDLAINCSSSGRYFSVWSVFLFSVALFIFIRESEDLEKKDSLMVAVLVALFSVFIYGVDGRFISNQTSFDKEGVAFYEDIEEVKQEIDSIKQIIDDDDKVYIIDQDYFMTKNEIPVLVAEYYLDKNLSNTHELPFYFSGFGSVIRTTEYYTITLRDLPSILTEGKFTYVWIYHTNSYLTRNLPIVLGNEKMEYVNQDIVSRDKYLNKRFIKPKEMHDGQLYKIVYKDKKAYRLRLVENLRKTDKRVK